MFNFSFER
jgi:hypothetical protein